MLIISSLLFSICSICDDDDDYDDDDEDHQLHIFTRHKPESQSSP